MIINEIEKLLGQRFCIEYNINTKINYEVKFVDAKELIVADRIDLIAKIKYVEAYVNNYSGHFFNDLYIEHIGSFTNGTFIESTQRDTKNTKDAYVSTFNKLIDDIKVNGIDPNISIIPVGKNNTILDGAHRVAIASYFGIKIPVVYFDEIQVKNDASFFENRMLPKNYLDYIIYHYCKNKNNIYTACLWPIANSKNELFPKVEEIFANNCTIVYKRKIDVNIHMLRNFMIQVYSGFDWLGALNDHFIGASAYAEDVNDKSGYLTLFILENDDLQNIKRIKNEIRDLYKIGNSSIHISDTHEESMNILQMLLNDNSLHCLKYAEPDKYKKFNLQIENLKQEFKTHGIDQDDLAIDSGSVLALYGLRDTRDIDCISNLNLENINKIEKHEHNEYYYDVDVSDIINNPINHFYYYGLKFVSIPLLIDMKKKRYKDNNETKDKDDIYLLNSLNGKKTIVSFIKGTSITVKRKFRSIKYTIIDILIHSIFYKPLKYIYYHVFRRNDNK